VATSPSQPRLLPREAQPTRSLSLFTFFSDFFFFEGTGTGTTKALDARAPYLFEPGYELPSSYIRSYTVVRHSNILILLSAKDIGSRSKIGDWVLPFSGRAEYIPEYNLLCTSDLSAASELRPPTLRHIWEDDLKPSEDWVRGLAMAYAVHLGFGKFCVARFFETPEEDPCGGGSSGFIHWGCERFRAHRRGGGALRRGWWRAQDDHAPVQTFQVAEW